MPYNITDSGYSGKSNKNLNPKIQAILGKVGDAGYGYKAPGGAYSNFRGEYNIAGGDPMFSINSTWNGDSKYGINSTWNGDSKYGINSTWNGGASPPPTDPNWTKPVVKPTNSAVVPGTNVSNPQANSSWGNQSTGQPATMQGNVAARNVSGATILDPISINNPTPSNQTMQGYVAPRSAPGSANIITMPTINAPATDPLTQPKQPGMLFQNTADGIGQGYTSTLSDALTGKMYDPFAAGAKEAEARSEANARAATGQQIASSGLTGQGMAQQLAGGTENQILKNRFDTNIGIEQARNASRVSALGEARAYGTEEQNQAQNALDRALQFGSDADVQNAYKQMTGKDLDPAAITQYRGYARTQTEQALKAGDIANQTAQFTLTELKKTQAGANLARKINENPAWITNPQAALSDPTFMSAAQAAWQEQGGTGTVPSDWALSQVNAVNMAGNSTIMANLGIDQLVNSGAITADQAAIMKKLPYSIYDKSNWNIDPVTGKITPNISNIAKTYGIPEETLNPTAVKPGITVGQGGVTVSIPKDASGKPTKTNGDYFYGQDGNLYTVSDGEPVPADLEGIPPQKAFDLYNSSTPEQQTKMLSSIEPAKFDYQASKVGGTDKIATSLREGDLTKITVDGKEIPVKVTIIGKYKIDFAGDGAYMEFQGPDGQLYHIGGSTKSQRNNTIRKGKTNHYDQVVGGNRNIA